MPWKPRWQALSAVSWPDSGHYLTGALARLLLARQGAVEVRFWGDAMEPLIRHGQLVPVMTMAGRSLESGQIVLAVIDHAIELCRIDSISSSQVALVSDADPRPARWIDSRDVLGVVAMPKRSRTPTRRALRRALLDVRDAWQPDPPQPNDPADSVREKYTTQAPYYAASNSATVSNAVREWMLSQGVATGTWLVAGCGAGSECRALRAVGCDVIGIDFSAAMIELAREQSEDPKLRFMVADLRALPDEIDSLAGVLFTPDVYSFLPVRAERIRVLRHLRRIVRPGGSCLLAARLIETRWDGLMATIEWLRSSNERAEWGDSRTRWVSGSGRLERSFVKLFRAEMLQREIAAGGWRCERRIDGCWLLR